MSSIGSKANRANPRSKGRNRVRISPPNKNAGSPNPESSAANRTRSKSIGKMLVKVDHEQLPADAEFKGYEEVGGSRH